MGEAKRKAQAEIDAAEAFLRDVIGRVDELGRTLRDLGSTPQSAQSIVAQAFLAVLWDQFRPQLAHTGAFVNVMAQMAHATVVEMRDREARAAKAN